MPAQHNRMKFTTTFLVSSSIILALIQLTSCEKKNANQPPTVKIVAPSNTVIEDDTLLSIVLEPFDIEGEINKVVLFINGNIVKEFLSPPYQFDFVTVNGSTYHIKAVVYDNNNAFGEDEKTIGVESYTTKFCGDFDFTVTRKSWSINAPTTYYTSYYNGVIRKFVIGDDQKDLYPYNNDGGEDASKKITIEFEQNLSITPTINKHGELLNKFGGHYYHHGSYKTLDTIEFKIENLGGLGGGSSYTVVGYRKK